MNLLINTLPNIFTADDARFILREHYKAPLKALAALVKTGKIIRLRRGLYAIRENFEPLAAASKIHGPSYISFETALSFYGLIPERVGQIISVADGRGASYQTDYGRYLYHSQERELFSLGMGLVFIGEQPIPMAIPEKALMDTLANHKLQTSTLNKSDILSFVVESLRVDYEELKKFSKRKMKRLAPLYRNLAPVKLFESLN